MSVREVTLPDSARALATLERIDYTDGFLLATDGARDRTAEEWARAMLEEAPAATRKALRRGWCALGVRVGSTGDRRRVLGWAVPRSSPDVALLAASSLIGMKAELLFRRGERDLLVGTLLRFDTPVARWVWAAVAPRHRRVVRHLVAQAGRRAG